VSNTANAPMPGVRIRRVPAVLWRQGEFGVIVLGPGDPEPQTLTGTGPALWDALARPMTPEDLASELARTFGVEPARVAADISPVLTELARIGAIEPEPA
jgi:hypothetical protein